MFPERAVTLSDPEPSKDQREIRYRKDSLTTDLPKGAKIPSGHVLRKANDRDKERSLPHTGKASLAGKSRGNTQNINIKLWERILK